MGKKSWRVFVLAAAGLIAVCCVCVASVGALDALGLIPTSTPTLALTNTPSPTTPAATGTFTVTPTSSITPTPTITPTPSITPIPSITPTATLPTIDEAACVPENTKREVGVVVGIVDGDTIDVRLENGTFRVRYIGIDTPESDAPFGNQATNRNTQLVAFEEVTLVKDVSETDRFDRLLRYVFVGDLFVNYELVRRGYATAATFPPDTACSSVFASAQSMARDDQSGLWAPTPTPRPTSPPVAPTQSGNCDPAYPDVCIPSPPPDLDCGEISFRRFRVLSPDPHGFDGDNDGIGCES